MAPFCLSLFTLIIFVISIKTRDFNSVKVAVYEHNVTLPPFTLLPVSRAEAVQHMMINLREMQKQAEAASSEGAKLLVLPEDGIYGFQFIRKTILYPYLEFIPDPKQTTSVPCKDSEIAGNDVQQFLSCLALNTSMYIVANMGDRQPCNTTIDDQCPSDGHYQYNTDVVFDPEGKLIAKYHKYNLFHEYQFDVPKKPEVVTFETPFGKFGIFTCFDILFHNPSIELVQNEGIRNIVFPTAWFDALPLLSAIGFHSAFATRWQINMLAANIHHPEMNAQGSGIYSVDGSSVYAYDTKDTSGRLLVSSIPILKQATKVKKKHFSLQETRAPCKKFKKEKSNDGFDFQSYVFHDLFNFVKLSGNYGNMTVCQKEVCCNVVYKRPENKDELFALGAFDGLHTYQGKYYLQICSLLKCNTNDYKSCGEETTFSNTNFNSLQVTMVTSCSQDYIYPEVVLSNKVELALSKRWYGDRHNVLTVKDDLEYPLLSASLISRLYDRD